MGAVMAVALEGARFVKARWELSDEDFSRIWTFCSLLFLSAAVYAFTANEGPAHFRDLFQNSNVTAQRHAGDTSARTAAAMIRWLPMIFFLFVAAQAFSSRAEIPLHAISLILMRRWKRAKKLGRPLPAPRLVNVAYPYVALCLFAASVHADENDTYFWGLCVLLAWGLWPMRSRRIGIATWAGAMVLTIVLGYFGQLGIGQLARYVENLDPRWLLSFMYHRTDPARSSTSIGQLGRIKTSGKIVIRLEPKNDSAPPAYLRETSYRVFISPIWYVGKSREDFTTISHETNETEYVLLPGKTNAAAVNIATSLEGRSQQSGNPLGLLPLPEGSGRLENLPVYLLWKNNTGAVLAEGPGLVVFDALYGPGATIDSEPDINDFSIPTNEIPALDQVTAELQLNGQDRKHALRTINGFFQNKFTYRAWQEGGDVTSTNDTPLSRFLLRSRSGHCEYFATATVLLLRRLQIPARYAVGFFVHEASGRRYVVRLRDAHAWCLVWDAGTKTWQNFDTTPASWVEEESKRASPLQWLSDCWSWVEFEFKKLRMDNGHLREYLLLALAPVLALLLYQIVRKRRRQNSRKEAERGMAAAWPGLDSDFYQVERKLAERGIVRQPNEPVSDWLQRAVAGVPLRDLNEPLQELLRLHYRYRFDPRGLTRAGREELRRKAKACLANL
jgi:hypothetical protein